MILFLSLLFTVGELAPPPSLDQSPTPVECAESHSISDSIKTIFHAISERTVYFGSGIALESASMLARLGSQLGSQVEWCFSFLSPWPAVKPIHWGNECRLLSEVCSSTAHRLFLQGIKGRPSHAFSAEGIPYSQYSWFLNQMRLSQIPLDSQEDQELLRFLERRWLAKSTGFYASVIDWLCPCYGIFVQVHPETTNSYARDPWNKFSRTYENRIAYLKSQLPHPQEFPLILTRGSDPCDYLPSYFQVEQEETVATAIERLKSTLNKTPDSRGHHSVIIDLTVPIEKAHSWKDCLSSLDQACQENKWDPSRILCIQRVQQRVHQGGIGGIRLLPLANLSSEDIEQQHQFLLERIAKLGLSTNRVELDRVSSTRALPPSKASSSVIENIPSQEEFVDLLHAYEKRWLSSHPQKTLMFKGTMEVLKGLFLHLTPHTWNQAISNQTRRAVIGLSLLNITEQLGLLNSKQDDLTFFDATWHIEQIHTNLSALLEIFTPFGVGDFPKIYQSLLHLPYAPSAPVASFALHSSGMTSLAGIFKAVEKTVGRTPHVLYGKNTYFENIHVANMLSKASAIENASTTDWQDVDLILAQFNPVLKRIDFFVTDYGVENIAESLRKALDAKNLTGQEVSLTLALDCTLDYIHSTRANTLLTEFQQDIENGSLNVVCYRSGLKFDLFGMDNYCGAPFYMLHQPNATQQNAKWAAFDLLLSDPVLQADPLSLNWFCLAYQYAAPQLELYRKQVFENTRALLNQVPAGLLSRQEISYRIVPVDEDVDPAFIDVKIHGFLHQLRGALIGGLLSMKCMEQKHPLFYRPSLGFYHPNCSMLFGKDCTTIRLTLGLDPAQVDVLADCFRTIDTLNHSSWK